MSNELPKYYVAKDIMEILEVSESKAYDIIRGLNMELKETGYLTLIGMVPIKYVE